MAAGLPVIASTHSCGPDVIREGLDGFIVPVRDPQSIADRLDRLASDAGLLASMSQEATQRAADFTIDSYSDRLVSAIKSIAKPYD